MYIDRSELFSVRNIILKVVITLLFVFLILFLFPFNKDNSNNNVKSDNQLVMQVYTNNIERLKIAGKDYFTVARLPKEIGDSVQITLEEMLEMKLILPVYDSNNKLCNTSKSYIKVTKLDDEYEMKIKLDCDDYSDYVIVLMGCYDFCSTTLCESPKPVTPTKTSYLYEYKKTTGGTAVWSAWSAWSKTAISKTSTREVQTEVRKENTSTTTTASVITTYSESPNTETKWFTVYSVTKTVCTDYDFVYTMTGTYKATQWSYQGIKSFAAVPADTETTKYVYIAGSEGDYDCGNCIGTNYANYEVYTRTLYPVVESELVCSNYSTTTVPVKASMTFTNGTEVKETKSCPSGYTLNSTKTLCSKTTTTAVNVTYYRYRTLTTVGGTTDIKWSFYKDSKLLNGGYYMTGVKKESSIK